MLTPRRQRPKCAALKRRHARTTTSPRVLEGTELPLANDAFDVDLAGRNVRSPAPLAAVTGVIANAGGDMNLIDGPASL
jgi:hypothetical protein